MNNTLKKVLSYIAVAFLGFASGVGCLIGVSSCSSSNGNDQQEKQQLKADAKYRQLTSDSEYQSIFDDLGTKRYYIVAKNANTNGKDVWYQDTITIANSVQVTDYLNVVADFSVINQYNQQRKRLVFETGLSGGVYHLSATFFRNIDNTTGQVLIYNAYGGVFNRENCAFIMLNDISFYQSTNGKSNFIYCLKLLFNVYLLNEYDSSFDFIDNFNYNAFLNTSVDTFINRAMYPVADYISSSSIERTFSFPWFYSNNLVFNQIKVIYRPNLGQNFEFADGHFQTISNPLANNLVYFSSMKYVNTATQLELTVLSRPLIGEGANVSDNKILYKPYWTSNEFKHLEFQSPITNLLSKNTLTTANSGYDTTSYQTNDVGLGNVFNLISLAFSSWLPILNIQVVPGITIGLLLFLPLISGIIILVIWIVKR